MAQNTPTLPKFLKVKGDEQKVSGISITSMKTSWIENSFRSYIPGFCNFYSYLLVFPFQITWCHSSAHFILTTSTLRKILCCISHAVALLATTPYLLGFFLHLSQGWTQATSMLTSVTNIICFITAIDFLHIAWKKSEIILEAANWHLKMKIVHHVPLYKIGFYCIFPLSTIFLDNPLAGMVNELIGTPSHNGYSFNTSFFDSDKNFLGPFYFALYISLMYGHLYYMVSTGFILALTLSINESISQLQKSKNPCNHNADMALYQYTAYYAPYNQTTFVKQGIKIETEIRKIMNSTNMIMSSKVLYEYVLILSFYATIFEFFDWNYSGSEYHRLHVVFYLCLSGAFWICACELHCMIRNYLKDWVQSYRSTFLLHSPETLKQYQTCLLAVQTEADSNPVCVSTRCFNVTYGFIGSMFGLIITYSTIIYQMKSDKNPSQG